MSLSFSFFFDTNSIGQSKAKCSMQLLQEMNPDVSSDYLDESVETILSNNPEFFNSFKVVIASSLKEKTLLTLSRMLWAQNIPFLYCRSVGFIASARLQYKEHFVVETHPDNKQSDLRLEHPFEALEKYLDVCELHIYISHTIFVNILTWVLFGNLHFHHSIGFLLCIFRILSLVIKCRGL